MQQVFLRGARHLRRVLRTGMRTGGEEVAGELGPAAGAVAAGRSDGHWERKLSAGA